MTLSDLRYAMRSLRNSPGFVVVAVLSLGLGLGLTTTMAAMIDAAVHPDVPFRDPQRLFFVSYTGWDQRRNITPAMLSQKLYDRAYLFEGIAGIAYSGGEVRAGVPSGGAVAVMPNYFALTGLAPKLGRTFNEASANADEHSAVLSYDLWRRAFPGRRSVRGATVMVGDRVFDVIGVVKTTSYTRGSPVEASVFTLLPPRSIEAGGTAWFWAIVRLRAGVTVERARAELNGLARELEHQYGPPIPPAQSFQYGIGPVAPDPFRLTDFHFAMAGAAVGVLLIACANLANLMLARGTSRRRELTLHMAMGATRWAVMRQMLAESCLIAAGGVAVGVPLTLLGADVLTYRMPNFGPWVGILKPQLSWRVFAFGAFAACGSVAFFGLVPAWRTSALDLSEPLKDSAGTTTGRHRRYSALAVSEIALSMVILMGTGLLMRAAERIASFDFGYDGRGLYNVYVPISPELRRSDSAVSRVMENVLYQVRHQAGVRDAALQAYGGTQGGMITIEAGGRAPRGVNTLGYQVVTPTFLATLGIPVVAGRTFQEADLGGAQVAIIDQDAARALYGRESPVGQLIKLGATAKNAPWVRVIGVARNAVFQFETDPDLQPHPIVYVAGGGGNSFAFGQLIVRLTHDDPASLVALQRTVEGAVPGYRGGLGIRPWLDDFDALLVGRRFLTTLFAVLGACALLLAAVGLYGVLAYAVSTRMREFGVRVALGADARNLLTLVLHDGLVMTLAGTAAGGILAMWAGSLLHTWLYNVEPTDAISLVSAESVLIAVTVAACLAPAFRAMRADPIEILRAT